MEKNNPNKNKKVPNTIERSKKLSRVLSLPALDGNFSLLAGSGALTLKSAPLFGISLMAGPTAIVVASSLGGTIKQNVIAALVASLVAMGIVVFAAAVGSSIQEWINMNVLQIFGGLAVVLIGLSIAGIKIPEKVPMFVLLAGFVLGGILK